LLSGTITGNGRITKVGDSNVVVTGNNTGYTGLTVVTDGFFDLESTNGLGTTGADQGTSVSGGTLRVGGLNNVALGTITEPLAFYGMGFDGTGSFFATANQTWNGQLTFSGASGPSGVKVSPGATLNVRDFTQAATGTYQLTVAGGGTFAINAGANGQLPGITSVTVSGSTFTTAVAQPKIGSLILNGSTVSGAGALTMLGGGQAIAPTDILSTGTSAIQSPMALAGARSLQIDNGTLTVSGVMSNGSISKIGSGILNITSVNPSASVNITQGLLIGNGQVANLNIANLGSLNPTATFTAANASFADQSALILDGATDNLTVTGVAALGGSAGIGGAVLLLYENVPDGATVINGPNSGTFDGFPQGVGITYTAATNVVLSGGGADVGSLVWFDPDSYVVNEGAGSVTVSALWSAGPGTAVLRNFGGTVQRDIDLRINYNDTGSPNGLVVRYTIPIIDNFLETGDLTTRLGLMPRAGGRIANAPPSGGPTASLTILDNDYTEKKKCGFGTGLTVFFLLFFGLLIQARLRRR
jgi:hypothetical protein